MSNQNKENIFRTDGLRKFYPQTQFTALRDVSLTVGQGEFLGIKGPSGSGKSTLLYLLGGLLKPTAGEIYFQERPFTDIKNKSLFRRDNIGFVFQDFYLYPGFSVLENVLFPCLNKLIVPAAIIRKAKEQLDYLNMGNKLGVGVETLSAGERQRVCIARALLYAPKCILADEPTGNLDSKNARNVLELLSKINDQHKITVIMVTHDDTVVHHAHRIVHIVDGVLQGG
jgi:putative ABC transport system ATP-binding protein